MADHFRDDCTQRIEHFWLVLCVHVLANSQSTNTLCQSKKSQQRANSDNPASARLAIVWLVTSEQDDAMRAVSSSHGSTTSSLRTMLVAAYQVDPFDHLIAPVGNDSYSTIFSLIPAALAVLRVAAEIESDPADVLHWYRQTHIAELGHLTAAELVSLGRSSTVIDFLSAVRDGKRD